MTHDTERPATGEPAPRADCAVDAAGRITFTLPLPRAATAPALLLRLRPPKGEPETTVHSLALAPGPGGRWQAALEVGRELAEGRWDLYARATPDAPRRRLRPGLRDLRLLAGERAPLAGPLAVRIPYPTKDGFLALRAWLRHAHAEAGDITVADGRMTVTGRLIGARLGPGARALLRRRGKDGPVIEAPLLEARDGQEFSFTARYAFPCPPGPGPSVWDVFLSPAADASPVRVGRLLDDVADRKTVFVYPATHLGDTAIRPYYTLDNDLSLELTPRDAEEAPA